MDLASGGGEGVLAANGPAGHDLVELPRVKLDQVSGVAELHQVLAVGLGMGFSPELEERGVGIDEPIVPVDEEEQVLLRGEDRVEGPALALDRRLNRAPLGQVDHG